MVQVMHMVKNLHKINKQPPPHVYAMAQSVYMAAVTSRRDQSLIPMGCQSSGKSTTCKHLIQYLVQTAGSSNKVFMNIFIYFFLILYLIIFCISNELIIILGCYFRKN
jgi:myosin-18